MDSPSKRKIGIIAWERFGFGGISRVVSGLINHLSNTNEIGVLCLKEKRFFKNVYKIDTNKVKFTFMEMTLFQKLRREFISKSFHKLCKSTKCYVKYFVKLKYSSQYLKKIANWIEEGDYDIIVFSTGFEDCIQLAAIKPLLKSNRKLIAWSHAGFTDYFRFPRTTKFTKALWSKYYKNFDAIVVLSDADVIECRNWLGLEAVRIYNPNSLNPTKHTSLTNKKFIYLGALSETKGTDILLNAFVEFSKHDDDWKLDIYGEGSISIWGHNLINKEGLQERIAIHPYTLNIEDVYCSHDIFILPSRFEGFGIVQIEAASCGLPIIISDVAIGKELIEKFKYGKLFKNGDSSELAKLMLELSRNDLKEFSENSVKASKHFEPKEIYGQWESLLNQL